MKRLSVVLGALAMAGAALVSTPARAQQPAGAIRITAPAEGATVSAPVTLSVDISGVTVKPAAEGDPNAFHYHALIDLDPATAVQPGQPLPTGQANIIHTATPSMPLPDLAPGRHTVTVVLTRTDHVPLSPSVQARVTFTVAAAGAGGPAVPGAPRTGTGTAGDAGLPVAVLAGSALVLAAGVGVARRRARSRR